MSGAGASAPVAVVGAVTAPRYDRRRHVHSDAMLPPDVTAIVTRSRLEVAILCVLYGLEHDTESVPDELFRNEEEVAIAKSLTAWEAHLVATLLMQQVRRQTRHPGVRSAATHLASLWGRRAKVCRCQGFERRPVRVLRVRSRPRARRRARAPARPRKLSDPEVARPPPVRPGFRSLRVPRAHP
jgi:hypothetical protein